MVWVWPGMLDTNVMVAPNSPSALAKASTMPAMMPGKASGKVTVRNASERGAAAARPHAGSEAEKGGGKDREKKRGGGGGAERARRLLEPAIDRLDRQAH